MRLLLTHHLLVGMNENAVDVFFDLLNFENI